MSTQKVLTPNEVTNEYDEYKPSLSAMAEDKKSISLSFDARPVIPILFIPGIMGSRLALKKDKGMAWNPPNPSNTGETLRTFWEYLWQSTADRMGTMDPSQVTVADDMGNHSLSGATSSTASIYEKLRWGSVWGAGYHEIMEYLMLNLNFKQTGKIARYRFEVWGGGYNWLQSNKLSAGDLKELTTKILNSYGDALNTAKKIIIVTHSMGGIVSRLMTSDPSFAAQVFGVVHIAQPATGAPATYKRMRAGFEGPERHVLGRNAADVTGILSNAHGGLELLPFANYDGGNPWLFCPEHLHNEFTKDLALPGAKDPYTQIYKSSKWYGLVPDDNLKLTERNGSNKDSQGVIIPYLVVFTSRAYAACLSFMAGVMPPIPM